ncbi:amidohydrolase family protein 13 [Achromobacter xylosoxidans A8]|uniref:Amidohydrolase family protein 13 n=1 Tax=Achromobacter xylosoxidans (strain A8) TaxID=762376 RepID=E3HUU1_ACHXA|nr:amidohydrolase [Achromobacter xylosoxidans]ADP16206.1 amidohydrolase family protein 13 [Achromobacter xylosoxidans A8]
MSQTRARTTIYAARSILTMNPMQPRATHVAVREGRILGVGSREDLAGWGPADLDERYADKVLMPGLVEGHCHLPEGGMWKFVYVGYYDRRGPDGRLWEGLKSFDAVAARLSEAERALPAGETLIGWGFDPIFFDGARMRVQDLDAVSAERPVVVMHASMHLMNVNTPMLARAGIDRDTDIEGITRMDDGRPSGELCEFAAMFPVMRLIGSPFRTVGVSEEGLRMFGKVAQWAGVTTATDLVNELGEEGLATLARITSEPDYPVRIVPAASALTYAGDPARCLAKLEDARRLNNDKLHLGMVKLVVDGSIQGFTARLRWPGYYNGAPNGIWVIAPAELDAMVQTYHDAGVQLHIHTNGDEATELAIDAVDRALRRSPRRDHRHTLQHCQMADAAQFRRMASLGMCANLFANHIFYWGDAHHALTMGPDRAKRMDACASAARAGVPFSIHSDAPITPLGPLFTAWCAVNRQTSSGKVLGESERIDVEAALHAVTLGAAYTLHLDHLVGSIEIGKHADFCVLQDDPLEVAPEQLKDVRVLGTVIGGRPLALREA